MTLKELAEIADAVVAEDEDEIDALAKQAYNEFVEEEEAREATQK